MKWILFYFLAAHPVGGDPTLYPITAGDFASHEACMEAGKRVDKGVDGVTELDWHNTRRITDWFCVDTDKGKDPLTP